MIASALKDICDLSIPECLYHPDLLQFADYKGMNTEIAKSINSLNKFKYMTRKMTYSRILLFFKFLDDTSNKAIEKKSKYNKPPY